MERNRTVSERPGQRAADAAGAAPPLAAPRKRWWLVILTAAMLAGWLGFLGYLAWRG